MSDLMVIASLLLINIQFSIMEYDSILVILLLRFLLLDDHEMFTRRLLLLDHHAAVASSRDVYTVPAARCWIIALLLDHHEIFFMAGVVFHAHHVRSVASIGGYRPCHLPVEPGVCL